MDAIGTRPQPSTPLRAPGESLDRALAHSFAGRPIPPYSVHQPTGHLNAPPKGVVMTIHGGGWYWTGEQMLRTMDDHVRRWNQRGWITVNVDHRPGGDSLTDIRSFYDAIRSWAGPETRIGMAGKSAGGHLALMLASERTDIEFVVAESAPTSLTTLTGTPEAMQIRDLATKAFGAANLTTMSPASHASRIGARLLLSAAAQDPWVPASQMDAFAGAHPANLKTMVLESGNRPFTHAPVSEHALRQLWEAEREVSTCR